MATPRKRPEDLLPGGRPTDYTEELAAEICNAVACHDLGLDEICAMYDHFPSPQSIYIWRAKHPGFIEKYLQAKQLQAQVYADNTAVLAKEKAWYIDAEGNKKIDPGYVAWQKMNVNLRQWHASKLAPKQYGDRHNLEEKIEENAKLKDELRELQSKLAEVNKKDY